MKIFLGSSTESLDILREVAGWIEGAKHQPLMWDNPELFVAGEHILTKLSTLAKEVDAAVLLFASDDKVWYRDDDAKMQPRDNVLIEYGLFLGALGLGKAIVCKKGKPKEPSDLAGVVHIDLDKPDARRRLLAWLVSLENKGVSLASASAEETGKRAIEHKEDLTFTIKNNRDDVLTVYWLDYGGNRREYFKLMPGESRQQHTYRTHPWVITDSRGKVIRVFYAPDDVQVGS
jgi:hypothetical protein